MRETFAKLRSDLVDKRLLPVVVLLVAGLIAIPVIAGQKRSSATAETLATTTAAAPPQKPKTEKAHKSATTSRDPFGGGKSTASAATSSPTTTSTPASTPTSSSSSSTARSTTLGTFSSSRSTASASRRYKIKLVDMRFGTSTTPPLTRNVARLSLFPSAKNPVAIVLGPLDSSRQAVVFQLLGQMTVKGQGSCVPRRQLCSQLILRPGQHVTLTRSNGKRYRLALVGVRSTSTTSKRRAARAHARVSKAGQCLLDTYAAFGFTGDGSVARRSDGKGCRYADKSAPKILGDGK